ncbi:hypothetical protein C8F04DRAFT_1266156 [Mycena alexandri]|uniref:Uncharacterized protein n=1 Tax=Mycena alexandri TaxID=1745969 RepID=A0AAD6SIL1_9AGAR|nr:hypothetical protein C8F04DRAFT_1266156 [Mycena alexandri]
MDLVRYEGPFTTRYVPSEMVSAILGMFRERDGSYTLAEYYAARANILRTTHRRFIVNHPSFWQHILVDSRTSLGFLQFCLNQIAGRDFHLEVWFSDVHAFPRTARHGGVERFIVKTMRLIASVFDRCVSLRIHAASTHIVTCVMGCFCEFTPAKLKSIITVYNIVDYLQYDPARFNQLEFQVAPPFRHTCPPAVSLVLTTGANIYPSVVYTSSSEPGVVITCPHDLLPTWWELTSLIASAPLVRHLVLTDIACAALPSPMVVSPPFTSIRSLSVAFNGNFEMAETLARLIFTDLDSVKFTIENQADMECMAMCSTLLASVLEVVIAGDCPNAQGLCQLFRWMHHVKILNLSGASVSIWNEFHAASSILVQHPTNHYACPHLNHLFVPNISLKSVKRLLRIRTRSNYSTLSSVIMPDKAAPFSDKLLGWFGRRGVDVNVI